MPSSFRGSVDASVPSLSPLQQGHHCVVYPLKRHRQHSVHHPPLMRRLQRTSWGQPGALAVQHDRQRYLATSRHDNHARQQDVGPKQAGFVQCRQPVCIVDLFCLAIDAGMAPAPLHSHHFHIAPVNVTRMFLLSWCNGQLKNALQCACTIVVVEVISVFQLVYYKHFTCFTWLV